MASPASPPAGPRARYYALMLAVVLASAILVVRNTKKLSAATGGGGEGDAHRGLNSMQRVGVSPPPEPLGTISFCAEKCRYIPEMCTEGLHRANLSLPAPLCQEYSLDVPHDIYWWDFRKNGSRGVVRTRNEATARIVSWAAARAREGRPGGSKSADANTARCEDEPTEYTMPMMWPEEFEFVVKLMANLRPRTYLEWGCGQSTSFYPLLASGEVVAIDGYPPWCKKVEEEPRVECMSRREGRLRLYCPELKGANGKMFQGMKEMGKIPKDASDADVEAMMETYVDSIDETNLTSVDVALVDGRFRLQCALKILPYLHLESVLLIHDFFLRRDYHRVFDYYYAIGYARSVVALRKRPDIVGGMSVEEERGVYRDFMRRNHLSRDDVA